MENNVNRKPWQLIGVMLILSVLFWIGADLRESRANNSIPANTVFSYYFDKSQRLIRDGTFPMADTRGFAPSIHKENAPPFLAYFTAALYKPISLLINTDFYRFAHVFPLFIFGFWLISIFFIFWDLFDLKVALAGSAIFSFLPIAIELTAKGRYVQELLGTLLMFWGVYILIKLSQEKIERKKIWILVGILVVTALVLTWQQFPFFYAAAVLLSLLWLVIKPLHAKPVILAWLYVLVPPLFLGEIISRLLIGIQYSPFAMFWEFLYAFWHHYDPDLLLAMRRNDWANLNVSRFYNYFGWLGFIFTALGLGAFALDYKNLKKQVIVTFSVVGFMALVAFTKDKFLALSFLLYLFALGLETLFTPENFLKKIKAIKDILKIQLARFHLSKKNKLIIGIFIGVVFLFIVFTKIYQNFYAPYPKPEITVSNLNLWTIGEPQRVTIELKNIGADPIPNKYAFGGLHIEVENADVSNVVAFSSSTQSSVVFKNFASVGNVFFFETKYDFLHRNETGSVSFTATPYTSPVKIYYRSWLPGSCSLTDQRSILKSLLPSWQNFRRAGWRNENCIQRNPANNDPNETLCRIPVLAAHKDLQHFRCFVK